MIYCFTFFITKLRVSLMCDTIGTCSHLISPQDKYSGIPFSMSKACSENSCARVAQSTAVGKSTQTLIGALTATMLWCFCPHVPLWTMWLELLDPAQLLMQ